MAAATILIIEDNTDLRNSLAEIVAYLGFMPIMAADGEAGIQAALAQPPTVILCDIEMPLVNGFRVFDTLCACHVVPPAEFYFLTASHAQEVSRKTNVPYHHIIQKPFRVENLLEILATYSVPN